MTDQEVLDVPADAPKKEVPYLEQLIIGPDDAVVMDPTKKDPKSGEAVPLTMGRMLYMSLMIPREEQVSTTDRVKRAKLARRIKLGEIKAFTTNEKTLLLERINIFDNAAVYGCVSLLDPAMLED